MADLSQYRILIADDEALVKTMYVERLQAEGFSVETASNGEEALATIETWRPHLVLLDVMMPKMNGFEVMDKLKHEPEEIKNTKVVLLTALSGTEHKIKGATTNALDYIIKSDVIPDEIVLRIKGWLDIKE